MNENKKYFASVWEGLFLDPKGKHYHKMGRALWLYLYLIRNADWQSGRLSRNYKTISDDMGVEIRVLKRWMDTLKAGGYIEICRRPYSMAIQITKWKPVNAQKRDLDRGDKNGTSELQRSDSFRVEKGQFSGREVTLLVRGDKNGTSVNDSKVKPKVVRGDKNGTSIRSLYQSSYQILKKKKVTPSSKFMNFAKRSHKKITSSTLVETKNDFVKISNLLEKFSIDVLSIAFVDFLKSGDPYLQDKPRNVPVFAGQISNLIEYANAVHLKSQNKFDQKIIRPEGLKLSGVENQAWERCLARIEGKILPFNFDNWIKPLVFNSASNGELKLSCPTRDFKACVSENYKSLIENAAQSAFGREMKLELII